MKELETGYAVLHPGKTEVEHTLVNSVEEPSRRLDWDPKDRVDAVVTAPFSVRFCRLDQGDKAIQQEIKVLYKVEEIPEKDWYEKLLGIVLIGFAIGLFFLVLGVVLAAEAPGGLLDY